MRESRNYKRELAVILGLFAAINGLSYRFQTPISYNNGEGWDGVAYCQVAAQLADHSLPHAEPPFVYRIGTPLLVSIFFKSDILLGFEIVNIIGNLATTLLFVVWLRFYLADWKTRVLLVAFFLAVWHGPVRFVYYYPAFVDPWYFVVLLSGLIGIEQIRTRGTLTQICCFGCLVFVGVVFRESALIIPVAFLFSRNPIQGMRFTVKSQLKHALAHIPATFFIPLGLGMLSVLIVHKIAVPTATFSFMQTAQAYLQRPLWLYMLAWFICFGPIIVVTIYFWRGTARFLAKHQFMLVYLLTAAVLGQIGGSDTERILFWSAPVVLLLVGKAFEDEKALAGLQPKELAFVLWLQLIAARIFWTIPDYPNAFPTPLPILTILSNKFQYFDLYSWHGNETVQVIALAEYVFVAALFCWRLSYLARKLNSDASSSKL